MSEVPDDFEFMSFPFTSPATKTTNISASNAAPACHTNSETGVKEAAPSASAPPPEVSKSQSAVHEKGKGRGAGSSPARQQQATKGKGKGKGKGKEKGKSAHANRIKETDDADDEMDGDDLDETESASWERRRKALKERGGKLAPPKTAGIDVSNTMAWAGGAKNQIETPNDERRRRKLEELVKLSETHSVSKAEIKANEIVELESDACDHAKTKDSTPAGVNTSVSVQQTAKADKKKSRMEMLRARHLQMQKQ